jgi:glycopeptide antibiotics resistance protein
MNFIKKNKHLLGSIVGAIIISVVFNNPLAGISVMFLIGVAIEFIQKFFNIGVFDLKDILKNLIGSVIGGGLYYLYLLIL